MNRGSALLAAGILAALLAGPVLTAHALVRHIAVMGGADELPREFALSVVTVLALAALAPLVAIAAALPGVARSTRDITRLRAGGQARNTFGISYVVIKSDLLSMFTAGLRRPTIFVTTAVESRLSADQFRAGLLHEQAHRERGDVLRRIILRVTQDAFGWLPGVRAMADALVVRSECDADRRAVDSGADSLALFEAIVAVAGVASPQPGLGSGQSLTRILSLTDPSLAGPAVPRGGLVALAGWQVALPLAAHVATVAGLACATHL